MATEMLQLSNLTDLDFFGGVVYTVSGYIQDSSGEQIMLLDGKWNQYLTGTWAETNEKIDLWEVYPDNITHPKYRYTKYTEKILSFDPELINILPPTDSRRRSDRILIEKGEFVKATKTKKEIEERQREDKKKREQSGEIWTPQYFQQLDTDEIFFEYTGGYWEEKEQKIAALQEGNHDLAMQFLNGGTSAGTACDFTTYQS